MRYTLIKRQFSLAVRFFPGTGTAEHMNRRLTDRQKTVFVLCLPPFSDYAGFMF